MRGLDDFQHFEKASTLPAIWDILAGENAFLKAGFLDFMEAVNPCRQVYYMNPEKRIVFVTYRLKLDIFSFRSERSLCFPVRILGIPLSVSCSGFACPKEHLDYFGNILNEFHLLLVMNTMNEIPLPFARTLDTFELDPETISLSKNSRARIRKAKKRGRELKFRKIAPEDFGKEHYALYEQVYFRSEGKLEKLSLEYFRKMDANIYEVSHQNELLAFFQVKQMKEDFLFLFCGVNKAQNLYYDTYLNLLLKIIELAKEGRAKKIHLGQTTEYSKCCVGGVKKARYLHLASRWIPNGMKKVILHTLGNKE